MKRNYIIGVCGGPVVGKSTFTEYLKNVIFKDDDVRVVQTGKIAKNMDEARHGAGDLGPEVEVRNEIRREILEGWGQGANHVIVDASPRVVGQVSFLQTIPAMLEAPVVICELQRKGKQKKHDYLFDERTDGLIDPEIHEKRFNWWNNNLKHINQELSFILPENVAWRVCYPNGATHVVKFHFESKMDLDRWVEDHYSIMTDEEEPIR